MAQPRSIGIAIEPVTVNRDANGKVVSITHVLYGDNTGGQRIKATAKNTDEMVSLAMQHATRFGKPCSVRIVLLDGRPKPAGFDAKTLGLRGNIPEIAAVQQ